MSCFHLFLLKKFREKYFFYYIKFNLFIHSLSINSLKSSSHNSFKHRYKKNYLKKIFSGFGHFKLEMEGEGENIPPYKTLNYKKKKEKVKLG